MRAAELLVGSVVLALGFIGAAPTLLEPASLGNPLEGNLAFHEITFDGSAILTAAEGAALAEGPVKALVAAPTATVTLYRYTYGHLQVVQPIRLGEFHTGPYSTSDHVYRDAHIQIQGLEDGLMMAWIPEGAASAFELSIESLPESTIHASASTTDLYDRHRTVSHRSIGPTYAWSHGGQEPAWFDLPSMRLGAADFQTLTAAGSLVLVLESADVTIEHEAGEEVLELRDSPGTPPAGSTVAAGEMTYAVLRIPHASFEANFVDVKAMFMSPMPTWHGNGTVRIEALEGRLSDGGNETDVIDRNVDIDGNTTLALQVEGDHDGSAWAGPVNFGGASAIPGEPRSQAKVDSTDWHATIDGVPLDPSGEKVASPSVVEEATFIAKVLGSLVILWAAARWLLLFIAGMVAEKPLANPRRRQIYELLQKQGMSHVRDLQRATGIPLGTLVYHLGILRQGKLVQSVQRSGYRVYYVPSASFCQDEIRRLALLADTTRRDICQTLGNEPGLSQEDLEDRCGITRGQIARQLQALVDGGLVEREGSRNARYRLSGLSADWLSAGRRRTHSGQSGACGSGDGSNATAQGS